MLREYYPTCTADSVFDIDYTKLYDKGYRGIIFDIDGTLTPHGSDSTPETDALFTEIHNAGLKTLLLTNNDEERVLRFIRNIDTLYICDAEKPAPDGYLRAIEKLGLDKREIICVGDQLFTDVIGANRCGLDSILVRFLLHEGETKLGIKRNLEKQILRLYRRSRYYNRIGDITKED